MHDLKKISAPVEKELKEFNSYLRRAMISEVPIVNLVAKYLLKTKGKQVRPMLVLLSAKAAGGVNESTYRAAMLVELLHTATLIHDDIIDEADTRRGFSSIRALWRNKIGVLMGDYLLAKGLLLTVESGDYNFLAITSHAVRRMSEGELYQIQKARQLNIDETAYFRIIADKTASLLSTCCELGAESATSRNPKYRLALKEYGEAVGMAFQIRDDLFDYESSALTIGKPVAIDLQEKKLTLPIIHTLAKLPKGEKTRIRKLIKSGKASKAAYAEVVKLVRDNGGLDYATVKAEEYRQRSISELAVLPESESKSALLDFSAFVLEREK